MGGGRSFPFVALPPSENMLVDAKDLFCSATVGDAKIWGAHNAGRAMPPIQLFDDEMTAVMDANAIYGNEGATSAPG